MLSSTGFVQSSMNFKDTFFFFWPLPLRTIFLGRGFFTPPGTFLGWVGFFGATAAAAFFTADVEPAGLAAAGFAGAAGLAAAGAAFLGSAAFAGAAALAAGAFAGAGLAGWAAGFLASPAFLVAVPAGALLAADAVLAAAAGFLAPSFFVAWN